MRPSVGSSWLEAESAPEGAVVLAVGRGGVGPALSRAADACALTSRPLHLLHVAPLLDLEDPAPFWVRDRLAADAVRLMDVVAVAAVRELARRGVHDRPTGAVVTGLSVIDGLLCGALGAYVVVMEHDHPVAGPARWVQHSRTLSVSGRSSAPVLSVPRPSAPSGPAASVLRGGVTVAVKHPHRADHLIRLALCVADREGVALKVVHARWPGSELVALSDLDLARTARRSRTWLEDRVARLSRADGLDGVQVRVEVRTRPPAEAVADAGRTSALLVVGRSDHRLRLGGHVGPVARAAADRAACPVLLVPESEGVEHRAARPQGG